MSSWRRQRRRGRGNDDTACFSSSSEGMEDIDDKLETETSTGTGTERVVAVDDARAGCGGSLFSVLGELSREREEQLLARLGNQQQRKTLGEKNAVVIDTAVEDDSALAGKSEAKEGEYRGGTCDGGNRREAGEVAAAPQIHEPVLGSERHSACGVLPIDVWVLVMGLLGPDDVARLMLCCRAFVPRGRALLPPIDLGTLASWHSALRPYSKSNFERAVRNLVYSARARALPFAESVDLHVVLANYDPRQDKRFSLVGTLPHPIKSTGRKICLVGDDLVEAGLVLGIDVWTVQDLRALNRNKKAVKKAFFSKYDDFIAAGGVIRMVPRLIGPSIGKAGRFPCLASGEDAESIAIQVESLNRRIKWQLKKTIDLNLAVGNTQLSPQELAENIVAALDLLRSVLKRGWKNVQSVRISSTRGASKTLLDAGGTSLPGERPVVLLPAMGAFSCEGSGASPGRVRTEDPDDATEKKSGSFYAENRKSRVRKKLDDRSRCTRGKKGAGTRHKNMKLRGW